MKEFLKQVAYTGIGIATLTKDKITDLGKQAAEAGRMSEEEGKKFVEELQEKAKEQQKKIDEKIIAQVNAQLEKLNIPTGEDIGELKKQLEDLKEIIKNMNG